jgi:acetamidase/formamidase
MSAAWAWRHPKWISQIPCRRCLTVTQPRKQPPCLLPASRRTLRLEGLTGGNLDDRRIGKGATLYYPVAVAGGLLSMGDAHLAQGDGELDGTAIETSITGEVRAPVHFSVGTGVASQADVFVP